MRTLTLWTVCTAQWWLSVVFCSSASPPAAWEAELRQAELWFWAMFDVCVKEMLSCLCAFFIYMYRKKFDVVVSAVIRGLFNFFVFIPA